MRRISSRRPFPTLPTFPSFPSVIALLLAGAFVATGCESMDLAPGEVNDIYVVAEPDLWAEVEDTLRTALQPTVLTVTDEPAFGVVHIDPGGEAWSRARKYKQLLLVGTAGDSWVDPALEKAREEPDPPEILQMRDVWSRNQIVTVLLLPSADGAGASVASGVEAHLAELAEIYDFQYRRWVDSRMFVSGRDSALADTLAREEGFTLLLPDVYQWDKRDSTYIFRNDNPSPDELIREVRITWRSPVPSELDARLAGRPIIEWRQELGAETLETRQVVDTSMVRSGPIDYQGHRGYEVQAIWQNPPEADWPAAGPFITRVIECEGQDRLYLVDAWLYAPGRDKYEYMIQLNTILDSFRCGG